MAQEHSLDFAELVKKVGTRKAIEIMMEQGIMYHGDFTLDHVNDPCFSSPRVRTSKSKDDPQEG